MLTTPAGTPASMYASMSFTADSGDADDGLKTTVLPAIIAALVGPAARAIGKLNGRDHGEHAVRAQDRAGVDRRVAEVVERVVVAGVVLHRLGVVADEVRRLLDLAERLDPVLADLEAHDRGLVHQPVADELGGAAKDRQALPPRRRRPGRLRGACRRDRVVDVVRDARREGPEHEVAIDRGADLERAGAVAPGAVRRSSGGGLRGPARTRATASSNPACRSSLSALSVAYVILMRGLASEVMAGSLVSDRSGSCASLGAPGTLPSV